MHLDFSFGLLVLPKSQLVYPPTPGFVRNIATSSPACFSGWSGHFPREGGPRQIPVPEHHLDFRLSACECGRLLRVRSIQSGRLIGGTGLVFVVRVGSLTLGRTPGIATQLNRRRSFFRSDGSTSHIHVQRSALPGTRWLVVRAVCFWGAESRACACSRAIGQFSMKYWVSLLECVVSQKLGRSTQTLGHIPSRFDRMPLLFSRRACWFSETGQRLHFTGCDFQER